MIQKGRTPNMLDEGLAAGFHNGSPWLSFMVLKQCNIKKKKTKKTHTHKNQPARDLPKFKHGFPFMAKVAEIYPDN